MSVRGDCLMERLGLPSSSMPPAQPAMLTRSRIHQHEADEALISSVEGSSASTSSSAPVSASSAPAAASPSTPAQLVLGMRARGRARQEPQAQAAAQQPQAKKQKGLADKGAIAINFEIEFGKSHFTSSAHKDKELRAEYHSFDMTTLGAAEKRFVSELFSARKAMYSLQRTSPYSPRQLRISVAESSGRKYKLPPLSASLATTRRSRFNPGPST